MRHPVTKEVIEYTGEQQKCIDYVGDKRRDLVVKSAAGGGKSLVILERAKHFLDEAKRENRKNAVIIFTYNNVLARYLYEWMQLSTADEPYIKISTLHSHLNSVYNKMAGNKLGYAAYDYIKQNALREVINRYGEKYQIWKIYGEKFWISEFAWMRNMNIFDENDRDIYLAMEREGRGSKPRILKEHRPDIFNMFCDYQKILRSKRLFDDSMSGDERILYLTHHADAVPDALKYDHVLIDEAQDQTLAMMIALRSLARKDVTVCMDANQRIYEGRWRFIQAGLKPHTKTLSYPFRCTGAIDALAESLKSHNTVSVSEDEMAEHIEPEVKGELPEVICCQNASEEEDYMIRLVKKWQAGDPKNTIGIICYQNVALDKVAGWLSKAHIEFEIIRNTKDATYSFSKPGVKLCTMHTSKGIEFMRVILPQFYQGMVPQSWAIGDEEAMIKQRNIAYVGMTRAIHKLVILYSGRKSQFISEMDETLYISRDYNSAVVNDIHGEMSEYEIRKKPDDETIEVKLEEKQKKKVNRVFF